MAKAQWSAGLLTAGLLALGCWTSASAQTGDKFSPSYKSRQEDITAVLGYRPRQEGVDYSRPGAEEQKSCTMKLIVGEKTNSTGWLLLDAQGHPLRRFFDSNGDQKIDVWSYYKDGIEVYRETASTFKAEKPDQFRWFNSNGGKFGIDMNEDLKIDTWRMISAEEVAQEAFAAVVTRDYNRLRALFITESELAALKLPEAQVARIREAQSRSAAKFQELSKVATLTPQAQLLRVESAVPQCVPADVRGPATDVLRFPTRAILYEPADKKQPEWLHTGEMIQVGMAWRLLEVPSPTDGVVPTNDTPAPALSKDLQKLMDDLSALDKASPGSLMQPGKNPPVFDYNIKRAALVEQIYAKVTEAPDKENWMKQLLDNLCTAHQANGSDNSVLVRLTQYKDQLAKSAPGSNIAGYAHFRTLWAKFAPQMATVTGADAAKLQKDWNDELARFVQAYPKAEDTPDALLQLGMNAEFSGGEDQAKNYYSTLATNFPQHPLAARATGAARRLSLNGQVLELAGPTLGGSQYDVKTAKGKVVVVYYWASNCRMCVGDFAQLKQLQTAYASKGLEIVSVNLDDRAEEATKYLQTNALPVAHLFQAVGEQTGLSSPLATQYGIMGLPTIFLVGKDGRVINRSIQINELDEAIRKAL